MLKDKTVLFLGAGSMAEAMISGLVSSNLIPKEQIIATNRQDSERLATLHQRYGITVKPKSTIDYSQVDVIFLAMKPQGADAALKELGPQITAEHIVISVLAAISSQFIADRLPTDCQVIRSMPNTSSMIQQGATGICAGKATSERSMALAEALLTSIGKVYRLEEAQMDVFTGIAGSGPAYFYLLMEHIEQAGEAAGLSKEKARELGTQTMYGAARMLQETGLTPTTLRENVTSPNGTTAAGLKALTDHGGGLAIASAVQAAAARSKELQEQLENC